MPFLVEVTESLKEAAAAVGVDLLILDNRYDAATALKNAEEFVRSKVDLVWIEFQVEHEVAPMIGDKIAGANIPLIAIDIPHPHATLFLEWITTEWGLPEVETLAGHAVGALGRQRWDWVLGWTWQRRDSWYRAVLLGLLGCAERDCGSTGGVVCAHRWAWSC